MTSSSKRLRSKAVARGAPADQPANLRIGITGHRRHRLKVSDSTLMQRILDVIELLQRAGKLRSCGHIEMVSALAEGADEIAGEY